MRKIQESEVTFTLTAEPEDLDPADHFASGDDKADKEMVEWINFRLDRGDVWAWFSAKVTATITLPDGSTIEGVDYLGGCSYKDEADFTQQGGYYDDMKVNALDDLQRELEAQIARGKQLEDWFLQCAHVNDAVDGRCSLAHGHDGDHVLDTDSARCPGCGWSVNCVSKTKHCSRGDDCLCGNTK